MKTKIKTLIIAVFLYGFVSPAMADPFIGEVKMFAGNFAPRGWAFCEGQTLPISQHQALFSLLGTTYGGDGRTTFKLPDLRNRAPVHPATVKSGGARLGTPKSGQKVKRSGGDEADPSTQSTLRINYIICLKGIFPARN